jgi:hypothetical protein
MRKPFVILASALAAGALVFGAAFYCGHALCERRIANPADNLDWLRLEFRLSDAELARIRLLHEGYLPRCETNCARIAAKKHELQAARAAGTNTPAQLAQLQGEVMALRKQCQSEMLAHFEQVSRAMPAEQGRRYLAEMRRLTLNEHDQVEQSMSGDPPDAHGHH